MELEPKEQLSMDNSQEQGFISYIKKTSEVKSITTVQFFDRSEYFTVHAEDALLAAREFFRTTSVVKYLGSGENKVASVVLSKLNFESFVRDLLLVKQYRVEVLKSNTLAKNDWEIVYKASPGNLSQLEDILFGSNSSAELQTGILGLKFKNEDGKKLIGAGYVDMNEQLMQICEFYDNENFCLVESLIVQLGAKECIISTSSFGAEFINLKKVLDRNRVLVSEIKSADFNSTYPMKDIEKLLKSNNANAIESKNNAILALNAVVKYLNLLSDETNANQYLLKKYELSGVMQLDSSAIRALQVESIESEKKAGRGRSLLSVLDNCCSSAGKRMLSQWLRQPLTDVNKIVERQNLVELMIENDHVRDACFSSHLKKVPDFTRLCRKIGRKSITLQDCYKLFLCVQKLPNLCDCLANCQGEYEAAINQSFIIPLRESIEDLSKYIEMINVTLDMEKVNRGEFVIKAEFDEVLTELRMEMDGYESEMQSELKRTAKDLGLEPNKSVKLEENNQYGYFFRVTMKDEKCLRNNKKYFILDSNKAGVRFSNSTLKELSLSHMDSKQQYESQQKSVADEIIGIASGYVEVFHILNTTLSTLDCIISLAITAVSAPMKYCRPKILPKGSGRIELEQCRHPGLEREDSISFIPNDCFMNQDGGTFHIVTGPNMGGKSTFLRSVGCVVLMAQIGSFVPCQSATISVVDSIRTRVGASDCQLKGVSTFMTEMIETATILKTSTENTLVIIDELGRGTSTYDGFGLAWAISEHIAKELGSFCLFATHFHELTALSDELGNVKNYHVTASTLDNTLTLLYQVKKGPCDRSFGIHVAELVNFPPHVIQFAKEKANELENEFDCDDVIMSETNDKKMSKKAEEKLMDEYLQKVSEFQSQDSVENFQGKVDDLKLSIKNEHPEFYRKLIQQN